MQKTDTLGKDIVWEKCLEIRAFKLNVWEKIYQSDSSLERMALAAKYRH